MNPDRIVEKEKEKEERRRKRGRLRRTWMGHIKEMGTSSKRNENPSKGLENTEGG